MSTIEEKLEILAHLPDGWFGGRCPPPSEITLSVAREVFPFAQSHTPHPFVVSPGFRGELRAEAFVPTKSGLWVMTLVVGETGDSYWLHAKRKRVAKPNTYEEIELQGKWPQDQDNLAQIVASFPKKDPNV